MREIKPTGFGKGLDVAGDRGLSMVLMFNKVLTLKAD